MQKKGSELLITQLRKIQKQNGFLSEESLKELSKKTKISLTKIFEVATFYSFFSTEKKGKHLILVCNSPSCRLNGSEDIEKTFEKLLGIRVNQTTKDDMFTLENTSCIGCCDQAPSALIDGKPHTRLDEKKISSIIKKIRRTNNKKLRSE